MHTPHWSVLAAALSLSLALGCSQGLAPTDEPHDGGILNHLGDAPFGGTVQLDSGSAITPGGGGGSIPGGGGGGGGGTGTGICGTDAATGDATLDACLDTSCCTSFTACYDDSACGACLAAPTGAGCSTNTKFLAFDTCWADNCDSSGGGGTTPTPTGNGVCDSGESTGDTTVDACLSTSCCTEFDACFASTSCVDCMYGSGTGCSSNSTYTDFDDCWYYSCG
jgi:hypothetical protein